MDLKKMDKLVEDMSKKIKDMEKSRTRLSLALAALDDISNNAKVRVTLICTGGVEKDIAEYLLPDMVPYITEQIENAAQEEYNTLQRIGSVREKPANTLQHIGSVQEEPAAENVMSLDDLFDEIKIEDEDKSERAPRCTKSLPVDDEVLRDLYFEKRMTVTEICRKYHYNPSSVYNAIKRLRAENEAGRSARR